MTRTPLVIVLVMWLLALVLLASVSLPVASVAAALQLIFGGMLKLLELDGYDDDDDDDGAGPMCPA